MGSGSRMQWNEWKMSPRGSSVWKLGPQCSWWCCLGAGIQKVKPYWRNPVTGVDFESLRPHSTSVCSLRHIQRCEKKDFFFLLVFWDRVFNWSLLKVKRACHLNYSAWSPSPRAPPVLELQTHPAVCGPNVGSCCAISTSIFLMNI